MAADRGKAAAKKANRQLVLRALTDPKFRKQLAAAPARALGKAKVTQAQQKEIDLVLALVKGIEVQVNMMADELLCACGVTT